MNRKGFAPIVMLLVVMVLGAVVLVGGYLNYRNRTPTSPQQIKAPSATTPATSPTSTQQPSSKPRYSTSTPPNTEQSVIQQLQSQWQSISNSVPFSPTLGSTAWTLDTIQFIGNSRLLVQFEDGHVVHSAVLEFTDYRFRAIKFFPEPDFSYSDWEQVVKQYGNSSYAISTYSWDSARGSYERASEKVFISSRQ